MTALDHFLDKNKNKEIVIVQGLGFVGAIMALVVANSKKPYAVIGVDLPNIKGKSKVRDINNGIFPIKSTDKKILKYYNKSLERGNFLATTQNDVYKYADIIIVDINLDVEKKYDLHRNLFNFQVNIEPFKKAMRIIAKSCKQNAFILIETTVPPGTTEKIIDPIFKEEFKKRRVKTHYKLAHSYERIMPGNNYINSIENYYRVYAGINKKSSLKAKKFLSSIIDTKTYPLTELKNTTSSEIAKVLENSFRAMNIAFIQEWTEFAENAKVNLYDIIDAIKKRDTHKNIMYPGLGVGGYCLTKDPLLASWASKNIFKGSILKNSVKAVSINDMMPMHTFKKINEYFHQKIAGKKFLFIGLSYLKNIGDTRSTPVELLFEKIKMNGGKIHLYDPLIEYWVEKKIKIDKKLDNFEKVKYDCIVLNTAHDKIRNNKKIIKLLIKNKKLVIDTNNILTENKITKIQKHVDLIIIGR